jgi:pentatricopeptide repeat protein
MRLTRALLKADSFSKIELGLPTNIVHEKRMEIGLKAKLQALTAPTRAQLKSRILMQTKECSQIQLHEALKMYANGFMYNHALVVYEIMVQRYPSLSKATHDIGLGCLFDLRKDAMPLFRALPQKDEYMYRSVLAGLLRNKRFSEALQVFGMIKKDTLEDRNLHLSILYQQNDKEAFMELFKSIENPNRATFLLCLKMNCKSNNIGARKHIFEEMRRRNIPVDIAFYNVILSFFNHKVKYDKALKVYLEVVKQKIEPNLGTLNSLFRIYAYRDDKENARKVFDSIMKLGQPDHHSYCCLLQLYRSQAQGKVFLQIYNKALALHLHFPGKSPDYQIAFKQFLKVLYGCKRYDLVVKSYEAFAKLYEPEFCILIYYIYSLGMLKDIDNLIKMEAFILKHFDMPKGWKALMFAFNHAANGAGVERMYQRMKDSNYYNLRAQAVWQLWANS